MDSNESYSTYLTSSGTAALFFALKNIGSNLRVAVPNCVCYDVVLAVLHSANQPILYSFDFRSPVLSLNLLEAVDVVILVHQNGILNFSFVAEVVGVAKQKKVVIIEDCALGYPNLNSMADYLTCSFATSKPLASISLDAGGAIISKKPISKGTADGQLCLSGRYSVNEASKIHTQIYNDYFFSGDYCKYGDLSRSMLASLNCKYQIYREIENTSFASLICERLRRLGTSSTPLWQTLSEQFGDTQIYPEPESQSLIWRYNMFVDLPSRTRLDLCRSGRGISTWFPPNSLIWPQYLDSEFCSEDVDLEFANTIINVALDGLYYDGVSQI